MRALRTGPSVGAQRHTKRTLMPRRSGARPPAGAIRHTMNTALALWRKVSLGRTSNISTVPTTLIVGGYYGTLKYCEVLTRTAKMTRRLRSRTPARL
jgi:hypothetical protein